MAIWSWLLRARTGGVLNPAMALAYAKLGQIPLGSALVYIICQIMGGLFAGGLIFIQLPKNISDITHATGAGLPISDPRFPGYAFVLDLITSAVLSFVVTGLIFDKRATPETYGLGYGAIACASEIATGTISSGNCNPARSIGPCLVLYKLGSFVWVPVLAQFIGALIGAILYDEIFNRLPDVKANAGDEYDNIDNAEGNELLPMHETKGEAYADIDVDGGVELEVNADLSPPEVELEVNADGVIGLEAGLDVDAEVEIEVDAELAVDAEIAVEAELEVDAELAVDAEIAVEL